MIKKITIEINLGDDAMQTTNDVVALMRRATDMLEDVGCEYRDSIFAQRKLRDVNGNTVGFIRSE